MKKYAVELKEYYEQKETVNFLMVHENADCQVFQNYNDLYNSLPNDLKLCDETNVSIAIYKDSFGKKYIIIG